MDKRKKKMISLLLSIVLLTGIFTAGGVQDVFAETAVVKLNAPLVSQMINSSKYVYGCWAATGISVLAKMTGTQPTMNQFYQTAHGNTNDTVGSDIHIKNGQMAYSGGKCLTQWYGYAMYWNDLVYWINRGQPMICNVKYIAGNNIGSYHFVVLDGYDNGGGGNSNYVWLMDPYGSSSSPSATRRMIYYPYFSEGYGANNMYEWVGTMYNWA